MGILNLKNKTAYKYIKKRSENAENIDNSVTNKIDTVLIVAEVDLFKTYDFTKRLSEDLGIDKDKIQVVLLHHVVNESLVETYPVFSEKSFGLHGKIKDESLKKIANTPFDLFINYCAEETVYGQVMACRSKAKLKVGFENTYAGLYDLSISISGNKIDTFNNEIIKYLQILNLLK